MIVNYSYYSTEYGGQNTLADFNILDPYAERIIESAIRYADVEHAPEWRKTAVKNAICAQVDYLALMGVETAIMGDSGVSFTVGKVSVRDGESNSGASKALITLAPFAKMFLEQTGLLNRAVFVPVEPYAPFEV